MLDQGSAPPADSVPVPKPEPVPEPVPEPEPVPAPVTPGVIERVLHDDAAIRVPNPDPELEALHRAILLEDVFGVTLTDAEIDLTLLADPRTASDIVMRHRGEH